MSLDAADIIDEVQLNVDDVDADRFTDVNCLIKQLRRQLLLMNNLW